MREKITLLEAQLLQKSELPKITINMWVVKMKHKPVNKELSEQPLNFSKVFRPLQLLGGQL